jgi:hypothetical protein
MKANSLLRKHLSIRMQNVRKRRGMTAQGQAPAARVGQLVIWNLELPRHAAAYN